MSKGIDYGMGRTNLDTATGIRYGVIPMNALSGFAWEDVEDDYGAPSCPKCGGEDVRERRVNANRDNDRKGNMVCKSCRAVFWDHDAYSEEPVGGEINTGGIVADVKSDGDAFVVRSPYFTRAQFCSPCAPGACYLLNPCEDGGRAYCFPHDWFDDGQAPYPVYRVDTGELVTPEAK